MQKNIKIAVEGNIGCGKSTVISRLCKDKRIPVFLEPVDEWKDWLKMFYKDPARYGLSFNLNVLLSFSNWSGNNFSAVYERSPLSNRYVFTELQYDQGKLNKLELELFDNIYRKLAWAPNYVIYIQTDPEKCMSRMQNRGRECESAVPLEYLQAVHDKYEMLCFQDEVTRVIRKDSNFIPVYTVNGNRDHDAVYADVSDIVSRLMSL